MDSEIKKGPKKIEISSSSVSFYWAFYICFERILVYMLVYFVVGCIESWIVEQAKSSSKGKNRRF